MNLLILVVVQKILLTREAAADLLALSVRKLDQLVASGELRPRRIGDSVRFPVAELVRFSVVEMNGDPAEEGDDDHTA